MKPLSAAESKSPFPEIDQNRVIRIALPDQASLAAASPEPFGRLVNFLKEYWQIWAIDHQLEVQFLYMPTEAALEQLKQQQLDIVALNIFERDKKLLYSLPYGMFKQSIFRNINKNPSSGKNIAIHAEENKVLDFLSPHIERFYYKDADQLLAKYQQYDAIYSTRPWLMTSKLKQHGIDDQFYINQSEIPQIKLYFSTRKNDRALMELINNSIRAVKPAQAKLWSEKYALTNHSNISLTMGKYLQNISAEEKQYLLDHNEIHYPVSKDGRPPLIITRSFAHITERGFTVDLIKFVAEKIGITFNPIYVENEQAFQQQITEKNAQLVINFEHHPSTELIPSIPYFTIRYNLIYDPRLTSVDQLEHIEALNIAAVKNRNATERLKQMFPKATIKVFDTTTLAIKAVADGKAHVFIGSSLITSYLIKQLRYANLTSRPYPPFNKDESLVFAAPKQHALLISLINKAINTLPTNQFDAMYNKWSQSAFPVTNVEEQIADAYRQASYVFLTIALIALIAFWVYYRQLQVRKIAQKKVEHALALAESARQEAETSAQAKITFLTRMSHEIRTPMNGVLGMTEALNYTKLDKEQAELLETLEGSARHLLALLNDVLDFSKMDAGKMSLESMPVNIHLLAKNVIKSFQHIETSNDIKLKLFIDDTINHRYYTDPTRLNQVLSNLISNAVKFTEHGTITLAIKKCAAPAQAKCNDVDHINISVSDTGIGISTENQKRLFTPFIQADSDITRKFGGTGLGLSICQEIVSAIGGEITIDSSPNQGSKFSFTLPLKRAEIVDKTEDRRKNSRHINDKTDNRFANIRVLIAEDNLVNVKVLTAQLSRLNIDADVAYDGLEALALHEQSPYDIIISDCHMPNMDGFELAKAILKQQTRPIWLIAVTADALSGAAENCMAAGFNDYMAKPCPQEEITNKMNHAYRMLQAQKTQLNHLEH
ncbi:ATP-binding protein [Thalassotalea sp. G2M2-11]|uniref:ATP-binding protein n=1 Tax=Thalassotalea sp. G2M2-11 TaxID=2787627 RepID=UPI0019D05E2F